MEQPRLLSINIGKPQRIDAKIGLTGIFKHPVAGPVNVGPLGLEHDAVLDTRHHGGLDQAVYIYLQSDYDWWAEELGEPLAPGTFGENLTIGGIDGATLSIGDRFTIGDVLLEVSLYRNPCSTLARRMGSPLFVKRFHAALRPGPYARVLRPGTVTPGDLVGYQPFEGEPVYLGPLMALHYERDIDAVTLRRALAAPVARKLRDKLEARLAAIG